jgi:hypothetical protein
MHGNMNVQSMSFQLVYLRSIFLVYCHRSWKYSLGKIRHCWGGGGGMQIFTKIL